jgi:hypothetical protein
MVHSSKLSEREGLAGQPEPDQLAVFDWEAACAIGRDSSQCHEQSARHKTVRSLAVRSTDRGV